MLPTYVADTHALIWYLAGSSRISARAKAAFDQAREGKAQIIVPAIVLAELIWVVQKAVPDVSLEQVLATVQEYYILTPLEPVDVLRLPELDLIPEMHDRLIVAETLRRGAVLITRDEAITQAAVVPVIW